MAQEASVRIDLAAEFTGKKAFKQADTATQKLTKNVKQLGGALGLAFGTAAVVNFSKQAVKAFAQDEAAAVRLTRAVENLGIGFANPAISKYIAELERSAAIADDVLRPAFQGLLTTTGSLTKSQELLNNAITISRASGIDLATVSTDLARGYVGITKGLKKYNTGLTTAEISSKSFAEVLGVILTRSAGAADDYLQTTQYRMDTLSIATGNASEIIGGGLVNAFARIGGGTEASDAAKAIEDIAEAVAFTTENIGSLIGVIPTLLKNLKNLPKNIFEGFAGAQAGVNITPKPKPVEKTAALSALAQQKALAKLEADAAKRQKAILALMKKQSDTAKKAAADKARLDKAAAVFELQKIQIAAALKGKISDEEKTRLLLMQAIEEGNADKAETLQKKLEEIQKQNAKIAADLLAIGQAKDPFATWAGSLALAVAQLSKLGASIGMIPGVTYNPGQSKDRNVDDALAAAAAAKAAADKAAADKAAAEAAAILGGAAEKVAAEKAAADAAAAKLAKDAADKAAAAALGGAGITFNPEQNPDRNYDTKAEAEQAAAAAAAALAVAPTNGSPVAGVNFNPGQSRDRNVDSGFSNAPTIIVNNNGSVIMQDEFVDAVNNALLAAERTGYSRTPAGTLVDSG